MHRDVNGVFIHSTAYHKSPEAPRPPPPSTEHSGHPFFNVSLQKIRMPMDGR